MINDLGQIMMLRITPGNHDDCIPMEVLTQGLEGKFVGHRGDISKEQFKQLIIDVILLRNRFIGETLLSTLKMEMGLEHTRHRSVPHAVVHVLFCLAAN